MSEYAQRQQEWAWGCGSHRQPTAREKASVVASVERDRIDRPAPQIPAQSPRQQAIEPQTVYQAIERLEGPTGLYQLVARYAVHDPTTAEDLKALDTLLAYVRTVSGLGNA